MAYELATAVIVPLSCLFYELGNESYEAMFVFPSWYLPIMTLYFSMFFLIFDFILNFYAELTGFADRQFYQDYWNSSSFEEYARKWNRPVHEYLHRHWYLDTLHRWPRATIFQATVITFMYSVYFHEVYTFVLYREATFYLTSLQVF